MTAMLLVSGICFLLLGLVAIAFGVPIKEFSFGHTLILTGAMVACSGAIMIGIWIVVRELKSIRRRLGEETASYRVEGTLERQSAAGQAQENGGGFLFSGEQSPTLFENAQPNDRRREEQVREVPAPPAKPRRNLLFSSTSRKERERAQARMAESGMNDPGAGPSLDATATATGDTREAPTPNFEESWPKLDRPRGAEVPTARRGRSSSAVTDGPGAPADPDTRRQAAEAEDPSAVTVLKSGVVDGMAYSLYSDGSIEAQMPEGMMRFASINELRAHLDQRP